MKLPELGELFEDRYELVKLLGEGGFARVYLARDQLMQRDVALKVLSPAGGKYRDITAARFTREVRMVAALQDPHTITLFDFGQTESGLLYMACEYIRGGDLRQVLSAERRLPPEVVAHILRQILSSLREAHEHHIIHRDIKPGNILIQEYEGDRYRATLVDFGLAKPDSVDATQLTREGVSAGTPRYMSPEQVLCAGVGPASDIYSLGLVAYELLTGEPAVDGPDMRTLLRRHLTGPPIEVPPEFAPPALAAVIARMTDQDLDRRYSSAGDVLRDLTHGGTVGSGRAADVAADAEQGGSKWVLAVGFASLVVVLGLVVASLWPVPPPMEESTPQSTVKKLAAMSAAAPSPPSMPPPSLAADAGNVAADATSADVTNLPTGCGNVPPRRSRMHPVEAYTAAGAEYAFYVPEDYDPHRRHPVVVMLHETGRSASSVVVGSEIALVADKHRFVVVAPRDRSITSAWQSGAEEAVRAALDALDGVACVDRSRVFLFGEGAGSAAAQRLACRMAIKGVATVSFRSQRDECDDARVPYIHFAGFEDAAFPVEGGRGCDGIHMASLEEFETRQRERHRCSGKRRQTIREGANRCFDWTCEVPFETCHLHKRGHFDKGEGRGWGFMCKSADPSNFDIAAAAWRFFDGQPETRDEVRPAEWP